MFQNKRKERNYSNSSSDNEKSYIKLNKLKRSFLSSPKRQYSHSSKSKRKNNKKLPPINPSLYRVTKTKNNIDKSNSIVGKLSTEKNKKKKLQIQSIFDSLRRTPSKEILNFRKNECIDNNKGTNRFISIHTFNIVKQSWSKDKGNVNFIFNQKRKTIPSKISKSKSNSHLKTSFNHFSNVILQSTVKRQKYRKKEGSKSAKEKGNIKRSNSLNLIKTPMHSLFHPQKNITQNIKEHSKESSFDNIITHKENNNLFNNSQLDKYNNNKYNTKNNTSLKNDNILTKIKNPFALTEIDLKEDKNQEPHTAKIFTYKRNSNMNNNNNISLQNKNPELQDNLDKLIDSSSCVYCLKRVNRPITLSCKHELCLNCAYEIKSIYNFIHLSSSAYLTEIKCPKCKVKTNYKNTLESLIRTNWRPSNLNELDTKSDKIQICEICPSSKYIGDIAEFECLNCDILLCYECKNRHLGNSRHQDHKIIQFHKMIQEKIELTLCETKNHRETLKMFCENCHKPICLICSNYEGEHKDHSIKTIKNIIEERSFLLSSAMRECEGEIKIIDALIEDLKFSKEKIENEKNDFIDKVDKIFKEIYEIINNNEKRVKERIEEIFTRKLNMLKKQLDNYSFISKRYQYYRNLICEKDIDIIERVIQTQKLNKIIKKIESLNLLNRENFNHSLGNSLLLGNPLSIIKKSISQFNFLPITDINIKILTNLFKLSTIITPDLLVNDFVKIMPKIKSGILLYQTSKDGISPSLFHEKCDNKGPTLTIVKTDTGHIFGGFNPISWISESMYNECEDSFIFSLSNGKDVNPIKCPVKRYMKHHAIKQNEKLYSPGFGETDCADLFISYTKFSSSYSNLGKVYKAPKNVDPNAFLAGRPNNWNILEVEVYAIEVINEDNYLKMVIK